MDVIVVCSLEDFSCLVPLCPPAEPMQGPRHVEVVDVQARQVTVRWEPFGYNVTRCHSYNLTVQYRERVRGGAGEQEQQNREELCLDTLSSAPQHTIHNLTPFTNLSLRLLLRNPEGSKESAEIHLQTDEDGENREGGREGWVGGRHG